MSAASDFLREFVDGLPDKIDSLEKSYQSITAQIDELGNEKTALEDGLLAVVIDDMVNTLLPSKTNDPPNAYIYTFGNFGNYDATGNVSDFQVYQLINNSATFTQVSPSGFVIQGVNISGQLSLGTKIVVTNGGTFSDPAVTSTVSVTGAPYPANSTFVEVSSSIVLATVDGVWKLVYEYGGVGWDSDADVVQNITDYAFALDHIHAALGTDGTYGIIDLKAALTQGRTIIYKNLTKTQGMETTYERFAT